MQRIMPRRPFPLLCILICVTAARAFRSGLVEVIPPEVDVAVGGDVTIYCRLNRTMTNRTADELLWNKGYPHFIVPPAKPPPTDWQTVINDTTKSLAFRNLTSDDTDYYYCYLSDESSFSNTDTSDVHVMRVPTDLENLTCSSISRHSFYCSWEPYSMDYQDRVTATFRDFHDRNTTEEMGKCTNEMYTPLVPPGYSSKCVPLTSFYRVAVDVVISNPLGTSTISTSFYVPDIAKPLPLQLTADDVAVGDDNIRLTVHPPYKWDDPLELVFLTFEVEYVEYELSDWVSATETDDRSFLMMHLYPHTEYVVRARTRTDEDTASDWSNTLRVETDATVPTHSVDNLHIRNSHNTADKYLRNVVVAWQGLDEHQKGADDFRYFVELIDDMSHQVVKSHSTIETNYGLVEISRFLRYTVRVFPGNPVGNGSAVQTSIHDQSGVPGPPVNLVWQEGNTTAGWLQWDDPEEPNCIITKFVVTWEEEDGYNIPNESYELIKAPGEGSFRHAVADLETFVTYQFSVCAVSLTTEECGTSATTSGTTVEGIPEFPPSVLGVVAENAHSLKLSWREPKGNHYGQIIHYNISYCPIDTDQSCLEGEHVVSYHQPRDATVLTFDLTGLESYTRYAVRVCAVTGGGSGPEATVLGETIQGTPDPPTNLRRTGVTSDSIDIAWDVPERLNGVLKYYRVEYRRSDDDEETVAVSQLNRATLDVEVYGHTTYTIRVRACSNAENQPCGEPSGRISVTTPTGVPTQPTGVSTSQISYDNVTLRWGEPKHPNGAIVRYLVGHRRSDGDGDWLWTPVPANRTSGTVRVQCDANEIVRYDFAVGAVNSGYEGPAVELPAREMCASMAMNPVMTIIILPAAAILFIFCVVFIIKYHRKVKRNLPDPYFIDAVKSSIYDGQTWNYNENQFFIVERESFDTLRCVDDSTQLLGLDRMHSTEGSTSSSDQGIHDMDGGHPASPRESRGKPLPLPPTARDKNAAAAAARGRATDGRRDEPPMVAAGGERFADGFHAADDAVFPDDTDNYGSSSGCAVASLSYAGVSLAGTPPNSPSTPPSSSTGPGGRRRGEDSGNVSWCGDGAATKYAKISDDGQLSPLPPDAGRPLSSASEDSMSYMRLHRSQAPPNGAPPNGATETDRRPNLDLPEVVFSPHPDPDGATSPDRDDRGRPSADEESPTGRDRPNSRSEVASKTPEETATKSWLPSSSCSSSEDDVSGYCKQDTTSCGGGTAPPPVSSSGLSSVGEEYSRMAHNNNEGDLPPPPSVKVVEPSPLYSAGHPPLPGSDRPDEEDPYVTSQEMKVIEEQFRRASTDLPPTTTPDISDQCINNNYVAPTQAM